MARLPWGLTGYSVTFQLSRPPRRLSIKAASSTYAFTFIPCLCITSPLLRLEPCLIPVSSNPTFSRCYSSSAVRVSLAIRQIMRLLAAFNKVTFGACRFSAFYPCLFWAVGAVKLFKALREHSLPLEIPHRREIYISQGISGVVVSSFSLAEACSGF